MTRLILPALRGRLGDWIYYPCLMRLKDVAARVSYARDIHKSRQLSDLLQRALDDGKRGKDIAAYLQTQKERFFNSLVVAVYRGDPVWVELSDISPGHGVDLAGITDATIESIGLLSLNGRERLFAIDGQHRLAGIKRVVKTGDNLNNEEVAVVLVAHKNTKAGMERSRRLFTTLNKTAERVSKAATIALDEDDVIAICTRRLVEEHPWFNGERISGNATNNLPVSNTTSLTTIGNLYDILDTLSVKVRREHKRRELKYFRPEDAVLDDYYQFACGYFSTLDQYIPQLSQFFRRSNFGRVVARHRRRSGGTVWFRPIGLLLLVEIVADLSKQQSLEEAVSMVAELPSDLSGVPYRHVIWNPDTETVISKGRVLARRLMLHMLGSPGGPTLGADYARALGQTDGARALRQVRRIYE